MLKSLANDWAKRRSAATVCVYEIGFDCCLHLKIAKYSSTPGSPSPRTGDHNYCPLVNHDGRQLAGGRNRDWGPQIHQNMQLFILEAFLAFKCYLNELKIQILAHQEAFWGSNSFTSSWIEEIPHPPLRWGFPAFERCKSVWSISF